MSSVTVLKALDRQPLSQAERHALTGDELFVLALARRLTELTPRERSRLNPADLTGLEALGLVSPGYPTQPGTSQAAVW